MCKTSGAGRVSVMESIATTRRAVRPWVLLGCLIVVAPWTMTAVAQTPETESTEIDTRRTRFLPAHELRSSPGVRSRAGFEKPALGTKIGHELRELHRTFTSSPATPEPGGVGPKRSLLRVVGERVAIDAVAAGGTEELKTALEALGLQRAAVSGRMVGGLLPIEAIPMLQELPSLQFVRAAMAATNTGSVTGQGDVAMRADDARASFGVSGAGVTVGVISDSFDCGGDQQAIDVSSGDLPPGIVVLEDLGPCIAVSDEGRALAQIVHDSAPGAGLAFHTGLISQADFATGISELVADASADIIVDDVFYYAEPFFQDGVIAQAVDSAVAAGVPYFSAAGNHARDSYESAFNPSGMTVTGNGEAHDFDPGAGVDLYQEISTEYLSVLTMTLQWDSPFFSVSGPPGSSQDLDIYIYDEPPTQILASSEDLNVGLDPVEVLQFFNGYPGQTFNIVIEGGPVEGPVPSLIKFVIWSGTGGIGQGSILEWQTHSSTVVGHANAAGAQSVGAAAWFETPEFGQSPPLLEPFSSAGGTPIIYDPAGNPTMETRLKPEVVCPDAINTTFFGVDIPEDADDDPNFTGTSAAAPYAAAIAALLIDYVAQAGGQDAHEATYFSPQELYWLVESTAIDMGPPGFDADSGYGLCQAFHAVQALESAIIFIDGFESGDTTEWTSAAP